MAEDEIAEAVERLVQRAKSQGRLVAPEGLRPSCHEGRLDDEDWCSDDDLLDEVRSSDKFFLAGLDPLACT